MKSVSEGCPQEMLVLTLFLTDRKQNGGQVLDNLNNRHSLECLISGGS